MGIKKHSGSWKKPRYCYSPFRLTLPDVDIGAKGQRDALAQSWLTVFKHIRNAYNHEAALIDKRNGSKK